MLVGESCVRLSSIRRLTRRGRGARDAPYRSSRRISSGLPATVAGRRWHAPNILPPSAAPSRSRFTLIKPRYSRTWGWSALQGVRNAGASRSRARSELARASRSPARSIARFAHKQADLRRAAHTRSEWPAERIGAEARRRAEPVARRSQTSRRAGRRVETQARPRERPREARPRRVHQGAIRQTWDWAGALVVDTARGVVPPMHSCSLGAIWT